MEIDTIGGKVAAGSTGSVATKCARWAGANGAVMQGFFARAVEARIFCGKASVWRLPEKMRGEESSRCLFCKRLRRAIVARADFVAEMSEISALWGVIWTWARRTSEVVGTTARSGKSRNGFGSRIN